MTDPASVSIVMVTHNAREWTERALIALADNTDMPHEVIVVDNASTDGTRDLLGGLANAEVVLNDENRGFGAGSNQGAALASAPHVLFLNSDVLVHPGWLSPLLELLDDESVAAVGPRLLNTDGTLQLAGALLSRSGSTLAYGFGDDPNEPEYTFRRQVDYLSGACLLVRRTAFDELGGFDPVYGLGYFEDADLCLTLAAHGYRVVYEPRSSVTHALGASGGSDALAALALRNRAVFRRRWEDVLASRPLAPLHASRRRILAARDAPATARILLVADASDPRLPALSERLAPWARSVRITVVALGEGSRPTLDPHTEVVSQRDGIAGWFEERRFHYDIVIAATVDEQLEPLLSRTQPTAVRLAPEEVSSDTLSGVGVTPPPLGGAV